MKQSSIPCIFLIVLMALTSCKTTENKPAIPKTRGLTDTVGFAHYDWQMDSVVSRINQSFQTELNRVQQPAGTLWKAAICPHDDYAYSGWLYPAVLKNLTAQTVIIFGVAHKAKTFGLENQIVFDSFQYWSGPYGKVKVSSLRENIMKNLPEKFFIVHDSMQQAEHSVEALIPFLQYYNHETEIISILVPFMTSEKTDSIATALAGSIYKVTKEQNLVWGKDFSLLITTDAVHYGDEEWGGKNYAPFGTDNAGYQSATQKEHQIIADCFTGAISEENAQKFYNYTVQPSDFKAYRWTWCGRYSVPLGLKTAVKLQAISNEEQLYGIPLGYQTSIDHPELKVDDLKMGKTATASLHHWVGYSSVGFR